MKKKSLKVWIIIVLLVLVFQTAITYSGFCYSQMRWPSKLEIVDRALFDYEFYRKPIVLSHEKKVEITKDRYSADYPEFCKVNDGPFDLKSWERFLNAIFGKKFFEVECIYRRSASDVHDLSKDTFYWSYVSVDSCAKNIVDSSGSSANETDYKSFLKKNQSLWRKVE